MSKAMELKAAVCEIVESIKVIDQLIVNEARNDESEAYNELKKNVYFNCEKLGLRDQIEELRDLQ